MTTINPTVTGRLRSTWDLLRRLVVDSGLQSWTEERVQSTPAARLRLQLFLTSFLVLFLELALIRWVPAHIRLLSFYMNFILLAVFLGIGLGILSARKTSLWLPPFPLVLFILLAVVGFNRLEINLTSPEVLYYGAEHSAADADRFILLPTIFTLVALTVAPLARSLGRLLAALPPLEAYAIDVLGSLAGIASFFFMSLFGLPPLVWFALGILVSLFLLKRSELLLWSPLLLGALYIVFHLGIDTLWSPYYRITVHPNDSGGYSINVNNIGHQAITPRLQKETFYFRVYDLLGQKPFKRVLVLGAGSGSDVNIALSNGAERVDAVEIDPMMYQLGVKLHPDRPYDDPRVNVFIEDGRTFLRNTTNEYDLIIYALPDSLTLTSAYSSLRLESFLLTTNSIAEARKHLSQDGALVLYNYYRQEWLVQKLAGMIQSATGETPYVTTYGDWGRAAVFISGPRLDDLPENLRYDYRESNFEAASGRGWQLPTVGQGFIKTDIDRHVLASDDWPFVYMPARAIPGLYLTALGLVLAISLALLLLVAPRNTLRRFDWHFFFLGAAFMLLETRSLVTFALLFGSTWMVNSLVFFAILSSVLLAILFNARFRIHRVWPLYVLLFAMLIVNYIVPQQALLGIASPVLRYTLASLLAFVPIFLANVVFSRSFRDTEKADIAFGSNLLGSMVGGVCEYAALASGYQSLLLLVILFYVVAYVFWRRTGGAAAAAYH